MKLSSSASASPRRGAMDTPPPIVACCASLPAPGTRFCSSSAMCPGMRRTATCPTRYSARPRLYAGLDELQRLYGPAVAEADAVILGSYVPDGAAVGEWLCRTARGLKAFYDIDTPVTLAKLGRGEHDYLTPDLIPRFDLYLSFTGGPTLARLEQEFGAVMARALYCSVDEWHYRPEPVSNTVLGRWPARRLPFAASSPTTRSSTCRATADAVTGARVRNELHRRGARHHGRLHAQRVGRVGGPDREDGRDRGRRRDPRQGDHDRHQPSAGEHGHQPLRDAGGRRHPGPIRTVSVIGTTDIRAADRTRSRSRRRGRPDARRRRAARAGLPRRARAARLGGRAAAVPGRAAAGEVDRHARRQPHPRGRRPPGARRRGGLADDVRRQAHDAAADGAGPRRRDVRAARRASGRAGPRSSPPGNEDGELYTSARGCAGARRRCRTSS